jgi:hypothetical protein
MPELPPRRRADRLGGIVLSVLGVAVAVVAVVALRHPNGRQAKPVSLQSGAVTTTATATTTHTATPTGRPSGSASSHPQSSNATHRVPLVVLNSTTTTGLADVARKRFEQGGWTVTSVGNISNDILSSCAYYDPSDPAAEQAAVQLQQQFSEIKRVKEKFPELPAGPVVVVLTSDFS